MDNKISAADLPRAGDEFEMSSLKEGTPTADMRVKQMHAPAPVPTKAGGVSSTRKIISIGLSSDKGRQPETTTFGLTPTFQPNSSVHRKNR